MSRNVDSPGRTETFISLMKVTKPKKHTFDRLKAELMLFIGFKTRKVGTPKNFKRLVINLFMV